MSDEKGGSWEGDEGATYHGAVVVHQQELVATGQVAQREGDGRARTVDRNAGRLQVAALHAVELVAGPHAPDGASGEVGVEAGRPVERVERDGITCSGQEQRSQMKE